jgi:hypothetical protein
VVNQAHWAAYAEALVGVHRQREQIARDASSTRSGLVADLERLGEQVAAQRARLETLGQQLRAPLSPADLSPALAPQPVPTPVAGQSRAGELGGWLSGADRAADEARQIAALPQLLPGWTSASARHAVVYALLVLPNAVFTIGLSLLGVTGSDPLLWWFVLIFPLMAAVGGGLLVGRLCAPRASRALLEQGRPEPAEPPRRRQRGLAVVFAWASWLVPGFTLDLLAPAWHR